VEEAAPENPEHVRAEVEVESQGFGEAEGDGDVVFQRVGWESRRLQGLEVPVERPGVAFDLFSKLRSRFSLA